MKKLLFGALAAATFSTTAIAAHNPTPPEGFKNFGQCRSTLAQEQNDVRKNPDDYTEDMADDINGATCEEREDGRFAIVF